MSGASLRVPLADARRLATEVVQLLKPACERIEIAGSIRRTQSDIGDIELLGIPRTESRQADLFGECLETIDLLAQRTDALLAEGVFTHRPDRNGRPSYGPRYKRLVYRGLGLDLFTTVPENWGIIFLIRTGPASFSQKLMTDRRRGGWMPAHLRVQDGSANAARVS